jgi:hypothetical protein
MINFGDTTADFQMLYRVFYFSLSLELYLRYLLFTLEAI